jgi:hypothetical protein
VDAALEEPAEPRQSRPRSTRTRSSVDTTALCLLTRPAGRSRRPSDFSVQSDQFPGGTSPALLCECRLHGPSVGSVAWGKYFVAPAGTLRTHSLTRTQCSSIAWMKARTRAPARQRQVRLAHDRTRRAPLIGKSQWRLECNFEFVVDGLAKACLQSATYQAGPPDPRWTGGHRLGEKNETANPWCSCRRDGVCVGTCCDHAPCRFLHRR